MDSSTPTAIIFVALPLEYQAVRHHLRDIRKVEHDRVLVEEGVFVGEINNWRVVLHQTGAGNELAATDTSRLLASIKPDCALFVGIAGGLKDVKLGDVVAADFVYSYEYTKDAASPHPRGKSWPAHNRLLERARVIATESRWTGRLDPQHDKSAAFVAPIASGSKVLASLDSSIVGFLRGLYSDAVAVEMEGAGFSVAAWRADIPILVVRGISDLVEGKAEADRLGVRHQAAAAAAAFAFQVLAECGPLRGTVSSHLPPAVSHDEVISSLVTGLSHLVAMLYGVSAGGLVTPRDRPPLLPSVLLARDRVLDDLEAIGRPGWWANLLAPLARGGTVTAALLARRVLPPRVEWIRAAGRELGVEHLMRQIASLNAAGSQLSGGMFESLARTLGHGAMVVVDDLPDLAVATDLGDKLAELHLALRQQDGTLVTISRQPLPFHLLHSPQVAELEIPPVSAAEIRTAIGVLLLPDGLDRSAFAGSLAGITGGNPSLVADALRFLEMNPDFGAEEFVALIMGTVSENLRAETRRRLPSIVGSIEDRQLLARLTLAGIRISDRVADRLAAVPPPISHDRDRLQRISPRLVRRAHGHLELNPLLTGLGAVLLPETERIQAHVAIGRALLENPSITPQDFDQAVTHLAAGRAFNQLAGLFLMVAIQVKTSDIAESLIARNLPFQEGGILRRREWLAIRAAQLRLRALAGEDVIGERRSFVAGLLSRPADPITTYLCLAVVGPFDSKCPPADAAASALEAARVLREVSPDLWPENLPFSPEALFVLPASRTRSPEEIEQVLVLVKIMSPSERDAVLSVLDGSLPDALAGRIVQLEAEKAEEQRDWPAALARLDRLAVLGRLENAELLRAAALRWKAFALFDYLGKPVEALGVFTDIDFANPLARLLAASTEGIILGATGEVPKAADKLSVALAQNVGDPGTRADLFYRLGVLRARLGELASAEEAFAAAQEADQSPQSLETRIKALGELAFVMWRRGARGSALKCMEAASSLLEEYGAEFANSVYHKTAQATGWYATLAETNRPPVAQEGSHYQEPFAGFFDADFLRPAPYSIGYLEVLLSRWALAEGLNRQAIDHAENAIRLAKAEQRPNLLAAGHLHLVMAAAADGDLQHSVAALTGFSGFRAQEDANSLLAAQSELPDLPSKIAPRDLVDAGIRLIGIPCLAAALSAHPNSPDASSVASRLLEQLPAGTDEFIASVRADLVALTLLPQIEQVFSRYITAGGHAARLGLLSLAVGVHGRSLPERTNALINAFAVVPLTLRRVPRSLLRLVASLRDDLLGNRFRLQSPNLFASIAHGREIRTGIDALEVLLAAAAATEVPVSQSTLALLRDAAAQQVGPP